MLMVWGDKCESCVVFEYRLICSCGKKVLGLEQQHRVDGVFGITM